MDWWYWWKGNTEGKPWCLQAMWRGLILPLNLAVVWMKSGWLPIAESQPAKTRMKPEKIFNRTSNNGNATPQNRNAPEFDSKAALNRKINQEISLPRCCTRLIWDNYSKLSMDFPNLWPVWPSFREAWSASPSLLLPWLSSFSFDCHSRRLRPFFFLSLTSDAEKTELELAWLRLLKHKAYHKAPNDQYIGYRKCILAGRHALPNPTGLRLFELGCSQSQFSHSSQSSPQVSQVHQSSRRSA